MNQMKTSAISFLLITIIALFFIDSGNNEIAYEMVSYERLPEEYKEDFNLMGPGGTGMFSHKGHTYAFILTEPDQQVAVEFVGQDAPMGSYDVKYSLQPKETNGEAIVIEGTHGTFTPFILKLEKEVSPPFGFTNTNALEQ
ncbi:hypothetical protein [Salinibacillus xinjiangensis]|uniref:Uncharacterized protein n=1 Tax=Salinibacillus xinjiangensis TaxID=1229268 RepID=A0A6G1X4U4_9BACI|nr:hypothetical protein [Salinibacillus xinjiangensis]MRG85984.1 hypothetical protein [Salinibacillus xinjiangensis]